MLLVRLLDDGNFQNAIILLNLKPSHTEKKFSTFDQQLSMTISPHFIGNIEKLITNNLQLTKN